MSESSQKVYTVSEARELLPELRPRLHAMQDIWAELQPHREEARKIGSRVDDGGATLPGAGEYFPLINRLKQKLAFFEKRELK